MVKAVRASSWAKERAKSLILCSCLKSGQGAGRARMTRVLTHETAGKWRVETWLAETPLVRAT